MDVRMVIRELAEERHVRIRLEKDMTEETTFLNTFEKQLSEARNSRSKLEAEITRERILIHQLQKEIVEEERLTTELQGAVVEDKTSGTQLEQDVALERDSINTLDARLFLFKNQLLDNVSVRDTDIQALQQQLANYDKEPVVFFVVSHEHFGPVTMDTKIPFPVEKINIGGGWKPAIGAFQAPKAGIFFLFASTASNHTGHNSSIVHTDLTGHYTLASMVSGGENRMGDTNAAIRYLQAGDYVTVQLLAANDGVLHSNGAIICTTFSGVLLSSGY